MVQASSNVIGYNIFIWIGRRLDLTTAEINESYVNSILERYCDVFLTELGTIKDEKAKLEVKPEDADI